MKTKNIPYVPPEIQRCIFSYIQHPETFFSCVLVCKQWEREFKWVTQNFGFYDAKITAKYNDDPPIGGIWSLLTKLELEKIIKRDFVNNITAFELSRWGQFGNQIGTYRGVISDQDNIRHVCESVSAKKIFDTIGSTVDFVGCSIPDLPKTQYKGIVCNWLGCVYDTEMGDIRPTESGYNCIPLVWLVIVIMMIIFMIFCILLVMLI